MIAIQVPELWNEARSYYRNECELDWFDISNWNADRIYYSYYKGSYEWWWNCVFIKDWKWWFHSMWHCSCYWPLDRMSSPRFDTIQEALAVSEFNEEQINFILKDYL